MATNQKSDLKYAIHPGAILKDYLKEAGLTQKKLSELMNTSKTVVNEIIKGKRTLSMDTAIKLETILGLPASFWDNLQRNYYERMKKLESTSQILVDNKINLDIEKFQEKIDFLKYSIDNQALLSAA